MYRYGNIIFFCLLFLFITENEYIFLFLNAIDITTSATVSTTENVQKLELENLEAVWTPFILKHLIIAANKKYVIVMRTLLFLSLLVDVKQYLSFQMR